MMPAPTRMSFVLLLCGAALSLAGCSGEQASQANGTTQMKDLEVVEGSANDAMTDLDGVKSEGTALVETASGNASAANASGNASAPAPDAAEDKNAEVVADQ